MLGKIQLDNQSHSWLYICFLQVETAIYRYPKEWNKLLGPAVSLFTITGVMSESV